jgi:hypothetical protein
MALEIRYKADKNGGDTDEEPSTPTSSYAGSMPYGGQVHVQVERFVM